MGQGEVATCPRKNFDYRNKIQKSFYSPLIPHFEKFHKVTCGTSIMVGVKTTNMWFTTPSRLSLPKIILLVTFSTVNFQLELIRLHSIKCP